jgi:two-component system, cell cycle response regulator
MRQQLLVIDDSPPIHTLVKAMLSEEPVDTHSAMDATYGLTLADSMKPDLILMDIQMPGMNGFEACKKLKENPDTAHVPVIFLTALTSTKEKVLGLELGAVDYITKPFQASELWARVRASLRMHKLVQDLETKALLDPLTGLGNRAMFDRQLRAEVTVRIRFNTPLSVIVMDVDRFKKINDHCGHPIGDVILQKVADCISAICRAGDVACRYGGDEFAIIAPHATAADSAMLAKRMSEAISAIRVMHKGQPIPVTASFGVADSTALYDRSMFQRADDALYRSKQRGRNQVSIATPAVEPDSAAA